ncbi:hypothetical protein [Streptococcus australis]|uniref:hypothetical protein n=1 Tax=Streptococcus australis TaxID=113107 RepID=UPI00232D1562|nr:hypothetical protein [Streptococcus australis]MDB8641888.1 hypothetical protein [Streptococcus australis]MDB8645555.1 hypothetical protein [Streptococcus australis]
MIKFVKEKLPKRVKKLLFALVVLIGIPFIAYRAYIAYFVEPYSQIYLKQKISKYEFLEDGKAIVVKWDYDNPIDHWLTTSSKEVFQGTRLIGEKKIVQEYKKLKYINPVSSNPQGQEYWGITVYDTQNQKLTSKDYNVFKLVREYNKNFVPIRLGNVIYTSSGETLLDIYIQKLESSDRLLQKSINLDTGKLVDAGEKRDSDKEQKNSFKISRQLSLLRPDSLYHIADRTILNLSKSNYHFPSDAKMWTMYPKAAEIFSEKESMIGILGKESDLEEYLPILKLFAKEGENLFSDVKIPAEYTVDGKEHVVNSQEEFYRNFKY